MVPSVWSKMNVQDTQFTAHFNKQSKMVSFLMTTVLFHFIGTHIGTLGNKEKR